MMKILFVAAEMAPLVKVGGLADVVGSLPKALTDLGHDVRVLIPAYGGIETRQWQVTNASVTWKVPTLKRTGTAILKSARVEKIPIYLVGNRKYFGGEAVYTPHDLERFFFFSRAVFELLPQLDWQPDIVHCHDWHTALLVMWLKRTDTSYATFFTIHNLAYQGSFDSDFLLKSGLKQDWIEAPPGVSEIPLNFLSQGILCADLVTTVSETYAQEVLTPVFGEGLDSLLRYRQNDLLGIVNGIDYQEYDMQNDHFLAANYGWKSLAKRALNKRALQKRANLAQDNEVPLIGMVQRLDEQKGFDIFEQAVDTIVRDTPCQFVILGRGREHYEKMLREVADRYPERVAVFVTFDNPLAHLIYGGCDMFLMPSRFEPCGLGQMIAMHYGAIPIVHRVGGLADTVPQFTRDLAHGRGFVFKKYRPESLANAVKLAVKAFRNQPAWQRAAQRLMQTDFSWRASARKYEAAYSRVLQALNR